MRSIPTRDLEHLLASTPADCHVVVNAVGNLLILRGDPGHEDEWTQVGYIDLAKREYVTD